MQALYITIESHGGEAPHIQEAHPMTDAPKVLNDVVDVVLAYRPKPKSAKGKARARKSKKKKARG